MEKEIPFAIWRNRGGRGAHRRRRRREMEIASVPIPTAMDPLSHHSLSATKRNLVNLLCKHTYTEMNTAHRLTE